MDVVPSPSSSKWVLRFLLCICKCVDQVFSIIYRMRSIPRAGAWHCQYIRDTKRLSLRTELCGIGKSMTKREYSPTFHLRESRCNVGLEHGKANIMHHARSTLARLSRGPGPAEDLPLTRRHKGSWFLLRYCNRTVTKLLVLTFLPPSLPGLLHLH